jgi:hypothetical protein
MVIFTVIYLKVQMKIALFFYSGFYPKRKAFGIVHKTSSIISHKRPYFQIFFQAVFEYENLISSKNIFIHYLDRQQLGMGDY